MAEGGDFVVTWSARVRKCATDLLNEPVAGHGAVADVFVLDIAEPQELASGEKDRVDGLAEFLGEVDFAGDPRGGPRVARHDGNERCAGFDLGFDGGGPLGAIIDAFVSPDLYAG